VSIEVTFYV